MTEPIGPVPQPADPSAAAGTAKADPRDRRVLLWWGVGLGLLAALGLFCWLVAVPVLRARAALAELAPKNPSSLQRLEVTREETQEAIERLGGPARAAWALDLYLRLPELWAPNRGPAIDLLCGCGAHAVPGLTRALRWPDTSWPGGPQSRALQGLVAIGPQARPAVPAVLRIVIDGDSLAAADAIRVLPKLGARPEETMPALIVALGHRCWASPRFSPAAAAAETLGEMGPLAAEATPALVKALKDSCEAVRQPDHFPVLLDCDGSPMGDPKDADVAVMLNTIRALGRIGPPAAALSAPELAKVLADKDRAPKKPTGWPDHVSRRDYDTEFAKAIGWALGEMGPAAAGAVPDLVRALGDSQPAVRSTAAEALKKIRGEWTGK